MSEKKVCPCGGGFGYTKIIGSAGVIPCHCESGQNMEFYVVSLKINLTGEEILSQNYYLGIIILTPESD